MNRLQEGSSNLDRIFTGHNLDFLIILSSLACIIGSHGQSTYMYPVANGSLALYLILLFERLFDFLSCCRGPRRGPERVLIEPSWAPAAAQHKHLERARSSFVAGTASCYRVPISTVNNEHYRYTHQFKD